MSKYKPLRFKYIILVIFFFTIGITLTNISFYGKENIVSSTQFVMGTLAEIKVKNENEDIAINAINSAFGEIKRVENLFSTYDVKSKIWKINHSDKRNIKLDEELYNFIGLCDSIRRLTKGAFDPSIGAVTVAWGFNGDEASIPSEEKIKYALINSGWDKIKLSGNEIIKKKKIQLDFGSVAKGYAVDKAVEVLKSSGINEALVNIGGEVKGVGSNWFVGIKHPRAVNLLIEKINLSGYSIATSGDYEKYFFEKGKRYNHIINSKTGYPSDLTQSVSVINKNNLFADALSTACFVMGAEDGIKLINSLKDTECLIFDKNGVRYESRGFGKFIISQ